MATISREQIILPAGVVTIFYFQLLIAIGTIKIVFGSCVFPETIHLFPEIMHISRNHAHFPEIMHLINYLIKYSISYLIT